MWMTKVLVMGITGHDYCTGQGFKLQECSGARFQNGGVPNSSLARLQTPGLWAPFPSSSNSVARLDNFPLRQRLPPWRSSNWTLWWAATDLREVSKVSRQGNKVAAATWLRLSKGPSEQDRNSCGTAAERLRMVLAATPRRLGKVSLLHVGQLECSSAKLGDSGRASRAPTMPQSFPSRTFYPMMQRIFYL